MKKFYLYHQTRTKLGIAWAFFDSYGTYDQACRSMQIQQKSGIWRIWKIEEVWEFT